MAEVPVWVLDTNVLVYSRDASEAAKQTQAHAWLEHLWRTRTGRLSYQVLQEYYVTVTEKLAPGLRVEIARKDALALCSWQPIAMDQRVLEETPPCTPSNRFRPFSATTSTTQIDLQPC